VEEGWAAQLRNPSVSQESARRWNHAGFHRLGGAPAYRGISAADRGVVGERLTSLSAG
jgi:hypothetical protein